MANKSVADVFAGFDSSVFIAMARAVSDLLGAVKVDDLTSESTVREAHGTIYTLLDAANARCSEELREHGAALRAVAN